MIDAINRNSDHCTEGGLSEFLEQTMDDFVKVCKHTEITDIRKYTKSLIWSRSGFPIQTIYTFLGM